MRKKLTDSLNFYETLYLMRPDVDGAEFSVIREKLSGALKDNKGEAVRDEKWDERDLAYEIRGYRRGTYHILTYKALPGVVSAIEKHLGFHKSEVMRFMTVCVNKDEEHGREPEKPPAEEPKKETPRGEERRGERHERAADSELGTQPFKAPASSARDEKTEQVQSSEPKPEATSASDEGEKKQ